MPTVSSQVEHIKAAHLAEAFIRVARANHYVVGVTHAYTIEQLDDAEQIVITKQNRGPQTGPTFAVLDRALDLIEQARSAYWGRKQP